MAKTNPSGLNSELFNKIRPLYPEAFISNEKIYDIISANRDETELRTLFKYLSLSLKSSPNHKESGAMLFNAIDASKYDLAQWIEAIHYFDQWLISKGRTTTFKKMLGYINCCNDSPENKTIKYKLIDILKNMLDDYGYEG